MNNTSTSGPTHRLSSVRASALRRRITAGHPNQLPGDKALFTKRAARLLARPFEGVSEPPNHRKYDRREEETRQATRGSASRYGDEINGARPGGYQRQQADYLLGDD